MKRCKTWIIAALMVVLASACTGQHQAGEINQTPAISSGPTWQEQYDLGIRYLSEGNYKEAILAFTAAIEIDPKQAPAYVGRGDAYVGLGEVEENLAAAKADYETAIELDETIAEAYLGLANVYIRQGEYEKALEILKQASNVIEDDRIYQKIQEVTEGVETDQFQKILNAGKTDHMLRFEEITFLGEPLRKFTIDELIAKMTALGMDSFENNEGGYRCVNARFERLNSGPSVSALQRDDESYVSLFGYDSGVVENETTRIGIRDLKTFDSMEKLFTALGFLNGNDIDNYICGLAEAKYDSYEELRKVFDALKYNDENFQMFFSSVGGSYCEDGKCSVVDLTLTIYVHSDEPDSYDLSFDFGGVATGVFVNSLKGYDIYIS